MYLPGRRRHDDPVDDVEDAVGADEVLDDDLHAVHEELVLRVPLEADELLHLVDALGPRVDDAGADGVGQQVVVQQIPDVMSYIVAPCNSLLWIGY